jgi:hypothetical protein
MNVGESGLSALYYPTPAKLRHTPRNATQRPPPKKSKTSVQTNFAARSLLPSLLEMLLEHLQQWRYISPALLTAGGKNHSSSMRSK